MLGLNCGAPMTTAQPPARAARLTAASHHPHPLPILQVVCSSDEEVFGGWRNVTKVGGTAA